jgi:hypothetical protein
MGTRESPGPLAQITIAEGFSDRTGPLAGLTRSLSRAPAAQEQSCISRIPSPSAFQRVAEAPSVQRFCVALLQDFLSVSDKTFGIVR